jgi:hypothetical protein
MQEAKSAPAALPSAPVQPAAPQPRIDHAATWQAEMDIAFATFLAGVREKLSAQQQTRPIVLTYANSPDEEPFVECTLLSSDPAHPNDQKKVEKCLEAVKKNGALVFERAGQDWRMHYRHGKDQVQSVPVIDPAHIAQLNAIGGSGKLADGFALYEPEHLPQVISIAASLSAESTREVKRVSMARSAEQLERYLSAAGLQVTHHPIDAHAPDDKKQDQVSALGAQLQRAPETQVIVFSTPAYMGFCRKIL